MERIEIYCDGACRGNNTTNVNSRIGAYAYKLMYRGKVKLGGQAEKNTTNNIMELKAVIDALKALKLSARKIILRKKINWGEDTPTKYKRGIGVYKSRVEVETPNGKAIRTKPIIDKELPIFSQDREFIKNIYITGVKE